MNKLLAGICLLPWLGFAASTPPPAFPETKIGLPPLSLAESAKQGVLPFASNVQSFFRSSALPRSVRPKFVSKMPIISPRADLAPRIRIKAPDESVDYKLRIHKPAVEPAK